MRYVWTILFVLTVCVSSSFTYAADNPFKTYNPDVDKYAFSRDFIVGLSYYDRVARRQKQEVDLQTNARQETAVIKTFIDDRTLDNTELRIARNYLTKFYDSKNGLIQKVSREATDTYDRLLELSAQERVLWQGFYQYKVQGVPEDFNEASFVTRQLDLAHEKKEIAKKLLEASTLLRTVMLSAERCESQKCQVLALSPKERDKLIVKLDVFAKENMDWGPKEGQTVLQACVATIREVLEDSLYESARR